MKAEELCIGDYVNYEGKPVRIKGLCSIMVTFEINEHLLCTCGAVKLDPIPLTPEILEKNGFVCVGGGVFSYEEIYLFYEDGKLYFAREAGYDKLLHVEHTHQLQHALRLAGIEKEIEV